MSTVDKPLQNAQLLLGTRKSRNPGHTAEVVEAFLAPFEWLPFDRAAAGHYAEIRYQLVVIGKPIGPNDLVIAAIARSRNLTLITHNRSEFTRVPGLATEDWAPA
ncbi:MAG: type II toxin-antitoxin system VapC family toxin [bacterium]